MLVKIVAKRIQEDYALPPPEVWPSRITQGEFTKIKDECMNNSNVDTANLRRHMFERAFYKRTVPYRVYESPHGKIIAILDSDEQEADIPWDLWWRALRIYYSGKPYTVVFLAHRAQRTAPAPNIAIQPIHINGGYTYPCKTNFICIYRAEDATRVLLHELFHASCSDNPADDIDHMEAKTEAWAELVYAAMLAHGSLKDTQLGIYRQSDWMHTQNENIRKHHMVSNGINSAEFPWRYTIGKEDVWRAWNIYEPTAHRYVWTGSMRLTPPPTAVHKQRENITQDSLIL